MNRPFADAIVVDGGFFGGNENTALARVSAELIAMKLLSMAETNCATWRGKSVPIWLREKGNAALGSDWFVGIV